MCSLSKEIEYQGRTNVLIDSALNLVKYGMPVEDAFKALKLPKSIRKIVLEKLEKN